MSVAKSYVEVPFDDLATAHTKRSLRSSFPFSVPVDGKVSIQDSWRFGFGAIYSMLQICPNFRLIQQYTCNNHLTVEAHGQVLISTLLCDLRT